jgi:hypothetical protein
MTEDYFCQRCGMPLDRDGDTEPGSIPPVWHNDNPYCGKSCARRSEQ